MEAILKILEKIIESKRVLWVVLLASFLFLCFEEWWRTWLRSDNLSDVAVLCSIVAFLVSASFIVIDWFSVLFRRVAGYFEARARIRKNKKMLSCLRGDEILLLREFIIINSNIIIIKNLPGNRAVDDLRKKGVISLRSVSVYKDRCWYSISDEIGSILFSNNEVLFDGVSWNELGEEARRLVLSERPGYVLS